MKSIWTILLLIMANVFMTFAWYGHLRLREYKWFEAWPLIGVIAFSWGIAFFEYCLQVPANRIGYNETGGPFSLWQLKVIQEVISLVVFTGITLFVFKTDTFRFNHVLGFFFLILAVYFMFKK